MFHTSGLYSFAYENYWGLFILYFTVILQIEIFRILLF
jgi:hypothetical protein